MKELEQGPAEFLLRHRYLVLVFLVVLLAVACYGLGRFYPSIDPKQHTLLRKEEQQQKLYYQKKFPLQDDLLFYIEPKNGIGLFDRQTLDYHRRLLKAAAELPDFQGSYSIFSLLPQGFDRQLDAAGAEWLRQRVEKSALMTKGLLSPDRKSLVFYVKLKQRPALSYPAAVEKQPFFKVGQRVVELRRQFQSPDFKLLVTGVPVMIQQQVVEMRRDLVKIVLAMAVISLLLMALIIRMVTGIVGAIIVAGSAALLLFGGMGLLNIQIDLSFILIPTLLASTISIGYTIHFLNHYRRTIGKVGQRHLALEIAWRRSFRPLLFTTLTTMLSLLSLLQTRIPAIQIAGSAAAVAILFVFILTVTVLPCVLSFQPIHHWHREANRRRNMLKNSTFVNRILTKFSMLLIVTRKPMIFAVLLLSVVMTFFFFKIEITLDYTKQMGDKLPFSKERIYLEQTNYVPFDSISLIIDLDERGAIEVVNLQKMRRLQQNLAAEFPQLVANTSSLVDVLLDLQTFRNAAAQLPANSAVVNGALIQLQSYGNIDPQQWVSKDLSTLKMVVNIRYYDAAEILKLGNWLEQQSQKYFPAAKQNYLRGFVYEESSKNQLITWRMLISYALSMLFIIIIFWFLFKKISVTLVAMIPNILPVLIGGGIIGMLRVELDYILMMIAPMVMGLAVDDTIHFCHYAIRRYQRSANPTKSLEVTMRHIGVSLIETSLILSLSFLCFSLARTNIINLMGWMAILGITIALVADLTLTQVLLYQLFINHKKKNPGKDFK